MNLRRLFRRKHTNTFLNQFKDIESVVDKMITPTKPYIGQEYFNNISLHLCNLISADYFLIGRYSFEKNEVESIVFSDREKLLNKVTFSLNNFPCKKLNKINTSIITSGAWKNFPADSIMSDKKTEGYIAIPLYNQAKAPNGVVIAMFNKPIKDADTIKSIINIFSGRMSSEIEHQNAKDELNQRNKDLEIIYTELTQKNKELDLSIKHLHQAQKKSLENDRLKTTFLSNLSHEIRTPMNVILGFSELLKTNSITIDERNEYIDIINLNGRRLLKVMDNLIDISKLQTRLIQEGPKAFNLNEKLESIFNHYTKEITLLQKPLSLSMEKGLDNNSDKLITDQEGLIKVLNHLLDNAIKFTTKGWIKFGYIIEDNNLLFFVKDTGIGVQAGKEKIIFDMFRQVTSSNSREFEGNGLGLTISLRYINALGGKIWLDKNYKDGAQFYFTLPFKKMIKRSKATVK